MHLLDINVLLALAHVKHPDHGKAEQWFASLPTGTRFATCSITEIGFVRVSVQSGLSPTVEHAKALVAALRAAARCDRLADTLGADSLPAYVTKAKDTTDGHLLALAKRHGAKLATLDTGIPGAVLIT